MSDEKVESSAGEEADMLAGRYRLLNVLGVGAMGKVFLAEDTRLRRTVAVKSVRPKWCENEEVQRRIKRECLMHAKIGAHPNIVTLYDVVEEGTSLHLIMEYVEGETLQEQIDRQVPVASSLFVKERVSVAIQCLSALAHTHNQGIIHRDIKPANIILVPDGSGSTTAKIMDFGIARFEERRSEFSSLTNAGEQTPGTPLFMAPEQIDSVKYGKVRSTSDIYATGVMLYCMLSGHPPFEGTLTDIFNAHLNFTPKPILFSTGQAVHPRLSKAVEKAMCKKPIDRFRSARAFEEELRAILASNEPLVVTGGDSSRGRLLSGLSIVKRRPRLLFGMVAGAVIILLAAFLFGRESTVTDESPEMGTGVLAEGPKVVQLDDPVPTPETGDAQGEDINGTMAPPGVTVASEELVETQISPGSQDPDVLAEPAVAEEAEVVPIEEELDVESMLSEEKEVVPIEEELDVEPMPSEDEDADVGQTETVTAPALETETVTAPALESEPVPETPDEVLVEEEPGSVEPMPRTYVVQSGDTLAEIAERFELDTLKLARWNLMENPNDLFAEQKLYLYERPDLPPMKIKPEPPPAAKIEPTSDAEVEPEPTPRKKFSPGRALKNLGGKIKNIGRKKK